MRSTFDGSETMVPAPLVDHARRPGVHGGRGRRAQPGRRARRSRCVRGVQLHVGVLGRGDEEQLVDEPLQPTALVDGHVEQLGALFVGHPAVESFERVDRTEHHRERRAQLVRDGRDEVALLAVQVDLAGEGDLAFLVQERVRHDERGVLRERGERLDAALGAGVGGAVPKHDQHDVATICEPVVLRAVDATTTAHPAPGAMRASSGARTASTSRSPTRAASADRVAQRCRVRRVVRRRRRRTRRATRRRRPVAQHSGRDPGAEGAGLRRERAERVVERDAGSRCAPTIRTAVRTGGVRRAATPRTSAFSATAAAIGASNSGTNGPCAARSSTTSPTGADVSVASRPAVAERTNTLWKRVSSTIERTAEVETTSRIEKHNAAPSAAPHAAAVVHVVVRRSAANAIAAAVVADQAVRDVERDLERRVPLHEHVHALAERGRDRETDRAGHEEADHEYRFGEREREAVPVELERHGEESGQRERQRQRRDDPEPADRHSRGCARPSRARRPTTAARR